MKSEIEINNNNIYLSERKVNREKYMSFEQS
jgi:hypothetical protein